MTPEDPIVIPNIVQVDIISLAVEVEPVPLPVTVTIDLDES